MATSIFKAVRDQITIRVHLLCVVIAVASGSMAAQKTSPSPTPRPQRLRVSQVVMDELCIHHNNAVYPPEAKRKGISGDVLVQLSIDRHGYVRDVKFLKGNPILAQAAIAAAKQWKYQPYSLDGEYIDVETTGLVNFR